MTDLTVDFEEVEMIPEGSLFSYCKPGKDGAFFVHLRATVSAPNREDWQITYIDMVNIKIIYQDSNGCRTEEIYFPLTDENFNRAHRFLTNTEKHFETIQEKVDFLIWDDEA